MPTPEEEVVLAFCAAIKDGDADVLADFFAPDGTYQNMPDEVIFRGPEVRKYIQAFTARTEIYFDVHRVASNGPFVFTERTDNCRWKDGGTFVPLPVAGCAEVRDGKITMWRDYYDSRAGEQVGPGATPTS